MPTPLRGVLPIGATRADPSSPGNPLAFCSPGPGLPAALPGEGVEVSGGASALLQGERCSWSFSQGQFTQQKATFAVQRVRRQENYLARGMGKPRQRADQTG